MKKLLASVLAIISIGFVIFPATAKASESPATVIASNAVGSQIRIQIGKNRNRRGRTRTYTRIVQNGRQRFRETIEETYFPNGRTRTRVISRIRVR